MQTAGKLAEGGIQNVQIGSQYAKQVSELRMPAWQMLQHGLPADSPLVQAYDKASPYVNRAADTAIPYLKSGAQTASDVASPLLKQLQPVVQVGPGCSAARRCTKQKATTALPHLRSRCEACMAFLHAAAMSAKELTKVSACQALWGMQH